MLITLKDKGNGGGNNLMGSTYIQNLKCIKASYSFVHGSQFNDFLRHCFFQYYYFNPTVVLTRIKIKLMKFNDIWSVGKILLY